MKRCLLSCVSLFAIAAIGLLAFQATDQGHAQPKPNIHDPAAAVANLDIHKDLAATLFVSEPKITNPTNLDIDHRGRIWLCDVVNYRGNNGKRKEGDRILILEDTDGDGVADNVKTFYQGRDIDSAMGICVLGNKVIVSASPNVFVFTFDENDKMTKKEVLFTKTGTPQHDHSAHSIVFGPDGRYYWNFGNTGGAVHDKNGKPVVDLAGNTVNAGGNPYRQGMAFRCDPDGSNFEVLGHNFRNNYELIVDSFGTVWQSDNDDDGNRGVRINYVMEYGNFGYVDEMNGSGWQTKRTNWEKEIPLRHWHLNDPGVVPNLLQTYQGSPTGITIYEGSLLPKVFQNQVIHCDAGPSIVRAYPVKTSGAGYTAETVNILDGNKKNNWFRPADVCVAPDGSLFVTDWYDPGVGGHAQRDSDRGRVFRVAPPGVKYNVPKVDLSSLEGCVEALKSPNLATRYIAWTKLHEADEKAEKLLQGLYASKVPHERARALWLLGQIKGKGEHYRKEALADTDPNIQIVGLRLARLLKQDMLGVVGGVLKNGVREPAVLRECAIALRAQKEPPAAALWAQLAVAHDGKDRWYLEALGIGAALNWDAYLNMYLTLLASRSTTETPPGYNDIVWRSRAAKTPTLLAAIITDPKTPTEELPRYFRAFDFQKDSDGKNEALIKLAFGKVEEPARRALLSSEALQRLKNFDLKKSPQYAAAVSKVLDDSKGTATFVEMVARFGVAERYPELLAMAQKQPNEQLGVDAMRALLDRDQIGLVRTAISGKDAAQVASTLQAIGNAAHDKASGLLIPIVDDGQVPIELRRQAARALARSKPGAQHLLKLAEQKKLNSDLKEVVSVSLTAATWKDIKAQADKLFPAPAGKDNIPLPTIASLIKMKGDLARGQLVYMKTGTCINCHQVNGEGKNVGPDLSEIGKKLSREAFFESILYPSAGISHNFEMYVLETKKGEVVNGLLVSNTPAEVAVKGVDAIVRTFKKGDVETLTRSPISLMPADLAKQLTAQDLVDVVEYLQSLREVKKGSK